MTNPNGTAPANGQTRRELIEAAQRARLLREREQNPDPRRRPVTPDSRLPAVGTLSGD
ncbi:hypothetical protein [Methylobacterium variabile]|uniref:hypothetical protein n=1 Tax=Methylobacterium variabile TaxID=298794 RepID=UPI000AF0A480|nr:hypothetical protein [Methylobacterium variabile]